jgi:DNA-binding transcriptional ArsR family regulator
MAYSKKELFSTDEIEIGKIAKALSHPARVKILNILANMNVCMCGDIVDLLPLSQSTVSQHLKELKSAGLIKGEVEGPKVCYCINEDALRKAKSVFETMLNNVCKC